jgi:MFS family permease
MLVAGMGFFTDAYDLFVIGVVVALLKHQWGLSTGQVALLNSVTLAAAALGAIVFGRLADVLGRKRVYGWEVVVLALGATASMLAPNLAVLLVARAVLGIGIGGDYPVSATIMSEYAGKRTRGRMVGLVFAMQGAGLVTGPLLAAVLLASHVPEALTWRLLLGFGAVPALAVFYLRRRIHETPRFARATGDLAGAEVAVAAAAGDGDGMGAPSALARPRRRGEGLRDLAEIIDHPVLRRWLPATAISWALLGFAYYGNTISSPAVLATIDPSRSLLTDTLLQLAIFVVFALPGYWLAVRLLDRLGRRWIQIQGFALMALAFLLMGLVPGALTATVPFVALFGMSYLFTEFGPNVTTFVYPAEIFPVRVRASADGLSAAAGKLGAFLGAFLFPVLLASRGGLRSAELVTGGVCLLGVVISATLLPEPKGLSLEHLERMAEA